MKVEIDYLGIGIDPGSNCDAGVFLFIITAIGFGDITTITFHGVDTNDYTYYDIVNVTMY